VTAPRNPDAVEVMKHLGRCLRYLSGREASAEAQGSAGDLRRMIEAVRACEGVIGGMDNVSPWIRPDPENMVCARCGSAEVECLDWIRMNDDLVVGGSENIPSYDYWCAACEVHEEPITAREYCKAKGHVGAPCAVCGRRPRRAHQPPAPLDA